MPASRIGKRYNLNLIMSYVLIGLGPWCPPRVLMDRFGPIPCTPFLVPWCPPYVVEKKRPNSSSVDVAVGTNTPGVIWILGDGVRLVGPAVRDDL